MATVGLVASIVTLVDLAAKIVRYVRQLVQDIPDTKPLLRSIETLTEVLGRVKSEFKLAQSPASNNLDSGGTLDRLITNIRGTCERYHALLIDVCSGSGFCTAIAKRRKWRKTQTVRDDLDKSLENDKGTLIVMIHTMSAERQRLETTHIHGSRATRNTATQSRTTNQPRRSRAGGVAAATILTAGGIVLGVSPAVFIFAGVIILLSSDDSEK